MVDLIEQNSGLKFKNYQTPRDMWSTLEIQKQNGLKLPDWINQTVYQTFELFSNMAFTYDSSTQLIHRMRAGIHRIFSKNWLIFEFLLKTKDHF